MNTDISNEVNKLVNAAMTVADKMPTEDERETFLTLLAESVCDI